MCKVVLFVEISFTVKSLKVGGVELYLLLCSLSSEQLVMNDVMVHNKSTESRKVFFILVGLHEYAIALTYHFKAIVVAVNNRCFA